MYAQIKTLGKGEAVIECKLRINDLLLNHEIEFKINAKEMVSENIIQNTLEQEKKTKCHKTRKFWRTDL